MDLKHELIAGEPCASGPGDGEMGPLLLAEGTGVGEGAHVEA